jgi:hypothetical protein
VGYNNRKRRSCWRKIRHPHYLSALLHARRLLPQDDNLSIYPCELCSNLHVGHSKMKKKRPVAYATLWERKKVRLERRIADVQQQLAQLQLNLERLLAIPPDSGQEAPRQST